MRPSEIRSELLEQHEALRSLLAEACAAVTSWQRNGAPREAARDSLVRVLDALRLHNLREEELLRDVLPRVDAWGEARVAIMSAEHVGEHRELYLALTEAAVSTDPSETESMVRTLRAQLLEHMAREEKSFLDENTLTDDAVSVDSFGG